MQKPKDALINVLEKTKSLFRLAKTDKYFQKYVILTCVFFILFTLALFPVETLVMNNLSNLKSASLKSVNLSDLKISLLTGMKFSSADIVTKTGETISASSFKTDISPFFAYFGNIDGKISSDVFSYRSSRISMKSKLSLLLDFSLDSQTNLPEKGIAQIELSEIILDGLTISGFTIPPTRIDKITGKINFTKSVYTINPVKISGKELSGTISGKIEVTPANFSSSKLDLSIEIEPTSTVFDNFRSMIGYITNKNTGKINFNVSGTVSNPQINPVNG